MIKGKIVKSGSGKGIPGIKLAIVPTFSGKFFYRRVFTSKEDGTFSIGGLQSGKYLVRGNKQEGFGREYVVVESGKTANDVIIKLDKPLFLETRVTPSGKTKKWIPVPQSNTELKDGDSAPDFAIQTLDGKLLKLSGFRSKVAAKLECYR